MKRFLNVKIFPKVFAMDFHLPELGEGVYEAEMVAWLVKPGDTIQRAQTLLEVLTDKATMEVPSPFTGTIAELKAEPGQLIKIGDVVLSYTEATPSGPPEPLQAAGKKIAGKATPGPATLPEPLVTRTRNGPSVPVKAAPSVRQMARKLGLDIARIQGSGPQGRVLVEDLSRHVKAAGPNETVPDEEVRFNFGTPGTRIKLHGVRRIIAEHMVKAKRIIPHYSYVDECDVSQLVQLRESLKEPFARAGIKLTYLPFFVKAAVRALKEVPIVNASLDDEAGEIVLHDRYHIGMAAATPAGLLVPVLHDADRLDLLALAREIERLSTEARAGKARREDLRGGTFTLTSIGKVGGLFATPIIPHPQVGILGIGKIVKRPVFDEHGQIRPADMVYLSFSFDHRVLDGAVGAAFGNALLKSLQNPATLLLPEASYTHPGHE